MTSVTALGIPTAGIRKATAVLQNTPLTSGGGGTSLPVTTDGELVTVLPYQVFRQKAVGLSAVTATTGTMISWFRVLPDVSAIKVWLNTPSDTTALVSFALADTEGGTEFTTSALSAQNGTQAAMIFMVSQLEGAPWIKITYTNETGGAITPTLFMVTQSTSMATSADATVPTTIT